MKDADPVLQLRGIQSSPAQPYLRIKRWIYQLVFGNQSVSSRWFAASMTILIILNVLAVILESEPKIFDAVGPIFKGFEVFSVAVFSLEYLARLWSCTEDPRFRAPILGRLRYAIQPMSIIDLASFLPFYLPASRLDLRFIRALRLFRLFRIFKIGRYSQSLNTLAKVIRSKKEELGITLFAGVVVLVIASSIMYYLEREYQPEAFSSIPAAMWWGVATLTTIGYGDIYPKTELGRIVGSFIAVLGIGLFALPAGIIASGFATEIQSRKAPAQICPHCGKEITNSDHD